LEHGRLCRASSRPHGDGGPDRHLAELYDLRTDRGELKSLINDPAAAPELATLKKELAGLMGRAHAGERSHADRRGIKKELPDQKIR
jgi:hypothetical protein